MGRPRFARLRPLRSSARFPVTGEDVLKCKGGCKRSGRDRCTRWTDKSVVRLAQIYPQVYKNISQKWPKEFCQYHAAFTTDLDLHWSFNQLKFKEVQHTVVPSGLEVRSFSDKMFTSSGGDRWVNVNTLLRVLPPLHLCYSVPHLSIRDRRTEKATHFV